VLATVSDDKTARVWDLATGKLLRTLRPPIGLGPEGKLAAVAVSPDGRIAACGGCTGYSWDKAYSIYLFVLQTGALVRRLSGLPSGLNHLAFSPDGGLLAAALGAGGVRLYRTDTWELADVDWDYEGRSNWVAFDARNRLAATGVDGFVRLYATGPQMLRLLAKSKAPGGKLPFAVVFSPDAERLALGYADARRIDVFDVRLVDVFGVKRVDTFDGRDIALLFSPDTASVYNGNLSDAAWSSDGRTLYAGGRYETHDQCVVSAWAEAGKAPRRELQAASGTVSGLVPLADGGLAFGASDPAWGVIGPDGARRLLVTPVIANFSALGEGFRLAADATTLRFSYESYGRSPAQFALRTRALQPSDAAPQLLPPRVAAPELEIAAWINTYAPTCNGAPLPLERFEMSRSLAIAPDGQRFVLGTERFVRLFDRKGRELSHASAPGPVWAVNYAPNGRCVVAALGDGTIRWYAVKDDKSLQEILAFFPHADQKRWALWTPSGYWHASPGGAELLGWQVNKGAEREADFLPASTHHPEFRRPDVIDALLSTLDEDAALRRADAAADHRLPSSSAQPSPTPSSWAQLLLYR